MEQQNQQSLEMPFIPFENIQLICEYVWLDQTENRTYYISILFCYWVSDSRLSEEHVKFTTHHSKSPPLTQPHACPVLRLFIQQQHQSKGIIIICDRGNEHSTEDGLIILIASGLNISINLIILWKTVFTNHMLFAHIANECMGLIRIHDIN